MSRRRPAPAGRARRRGPRTRRGPDALAARQIIVAAWVVVGIVGFARRYFGAHLPLDVVGGIGAGLVCGVVAGALVGIPAVTR